MDINSVDICCGLAWGDEAKGKIVSQLAKSKKYNFICRWSGGNNAGHTVYVNNVKYKTHLIPCGIFYNVPSIIGPDCIVHVESFLNEISYLKENNFNVSLVKISPRAHIIKDEHVQEDINTLKAAQGSTSRGIAPCYSDKYRRVGTMAREIDKLKDLWFNINYYKDYNMIHDHFGNNNKLSGAYYVKAPKKSGNIIAFKDKKFKKKSFKKKKFFKKAK